MPQLRYSLFFILCGTLSAFAGPSLSVKDKVGRSMVIEVTALAGDLVSFTRTSDGKTFTLPLSTFDADSTARIQAKKGELGEAHPLYGIDVLIDKRRKKSENNYYMVEQIVTAKVTLKNPAPNQAAPNAKARVLYLGEDQRTKGRHTVLGAEEYDFQLANNATNTREIASCTTQYDSDNKGYGNVGGQQYEGYLVLIMDSKGKVIQHQTTCSKLDQLFAEKSQYKAIYKSLAPLSVLDDKFIPTGDKATLVR